MTMSGLPSETSRRTEPPASQSTNEYYEQHADEYFERTVQADLTHLYLPFLARIPPVARILDVGCGSGRDLRYFAARGHLATGIDASQKLAAIAQRYAGVPCAAMRMEEIAFREEFDGIWACASLLHLSKWSMPGVLERLVLALVKGGVLFVSIQEGSGEGQAPDGRWYSYYGEVEFNGLLRASGFEVSKSWITGDSLQQQRPLRWINALATRAR